VAKRLEVLPAAIEKALAATRWYLEQDERVAEAFEVELSWAFDRIERVPETWPEHHHGTRRALLRRFPYDVIYKIYSEVVLIVAVAHGKRKPGYWRHR
jgi:plasmid stabilization system protein ParE